MLKERGIQNRGKESRSQRIPRNNELIKRYEKIDSKYVYYYKKTELVYFFLNTTKHYRYFNLFVA